MTDIMSFDVDPPTDYQKERERMKAPVLFTEVYRVETVELTDDDRISVEMRSTTGEGTPIVFTAPTGSPIVVGDKYVGEFRKVYQP